MGPYGALWGPVGRYGGLWGPMGPCGALWGPVGPYGALWSPMGPYGALWGPGGAGETQNHLLCFCLGYLARGGSFEQKPDAKQYFY